MATRSSELPEPCDECRGANPNWVTVYRNDGSSGVARCGCARGRMLAAMSARPVPPQRAEPVLTAEEISGAVEGLSAMPWFPKEEGARTMIADAIARLCSNSQACFEMVRLVLERYREWPGVREMRICYCAVIGSPLSGDDLRTEISEFYPDGFGRAVWQGIPRQALPPGHVVTADKLLDSAVRSLAIEKDIDKPAQRAYRVDFSESQEARREMLRQQHREAMAAIPNPITQADIDRALEERRAKRAGESE